MIQDPQLKLSHLAQAPVETHELAATAAPFHFLTRSLVTTYTVLFNPWITNSVMNASWAAEHQDRKVLFLKIGRAKGRWNWC